MGGLFLSSLDANQHSVLALRSDHLISGTKDIVIRCQLILKARIIPDRQDAIAKVSKFPSLTLIGLFSNWLVMVGTVAKRTTPGTPSRS